MDGGKHLNYGGASKISAFLAEYLEKECGLTGRKSQAYEEDLPLYRAMCDVTELQMVNDLTAYLDMIARYDDVTVFLSVADDMMSNMPKEGRAALRRLGLQTDFDSLSYSDAFLAVIENGTVRCEMSSNRRISYEDVLRNGQAYLISSCGYLVGTESKIVINGCDYSLNHRGINIVVLDNASGKVLDSAAFDTWDVPGHQSAIRNNPKTEKFLREYEEYLMVQDAKTGLELRKMELVANMSFTSVPFFLFATMTVMLYYLFPKRCQWVVLLVSSIIFYATYGLAQFVPMLLAAIVAYLAARWIQEIYDAEEGGTAAERKAKCKGNLLFAVTVLVILLLYAKLGNFVLQGLAGVLSLNGNSMQV